jgi:hypothetical protein
LRVGYEPGVDPKTDRKVAAKDKQQSNDHASLRAVPPRR